MVLASVEDNVSVIASFVERLYGQRSLLNKVRFISSTSLQVGMYYYASECDDKGGGLVPPELHCSYAIGYL